jgi:uncharacterized membrane protein
MGYQLLVYCLVIDQPDGGPAEVLMAAPILFVAACVLARSARGRLLAAVLTMLAVLGFLASIRFGANTAWFYPVPYVTVYLVLLWGFGRTLRAGRQPLVTRLALHVHGTIPPEIELYTRRVTWAWSLFFAAMAATSLLLFLLEPLAVWSVFNSLMNLPLVVAMFMAEYAWRLWRYPDFPHASIAAMWRAAQHFDFSQSRSGW